MSKSAKLPEIGWSLLVKSEDVPVNGRSIEISPNENEKKALAKRFDILSLDDLKAKVSLTRENAHIIHVKGTLEAKVKQACVITLEPVESDITDEFEAWYADESQAVSFKRAQHEAQSKKELLDMPMLEESEDPEPMTNGAVDVGDLVAQYLSLAIPPFPTKEGFSYSVEVEAPKEAKNPMKLNPFAALKDWRPKD